MQQHTEWLDKLQTLIDALGLVEPSHLPASFGTDLLQPVADEGPARLEDIRDHLAGLQLMRSLSELSIQGEDRPWYFWEKAGSLAAAFVGAETAHIYRLGDRGVLHKIHPLEPEEDTQEFLWPRTVDGETQASPVAGQAQAWLVRVGRFAETPLVFHFLRTGPAPRISQPRLHLLAESGQMLYDLLKARVPAPDLTRNMLIVGEEGKDEAAGDILGHDPAFLQSLAAVRQASQSDAPVYLKGESGTGKELFARYLHAHSSFSDGPFVPINCSAVPSELIESELFGHEKGAFTGAYFRKIGKAEQAAGGTLFLDEIGEMPLPFQAKLLRYLQEKRFTRVGGNQQVVSDARIVVATHRDLKEMVAAGTFREDLYYRVHVIPITIAPLRERGGDIRFIAQKFFARYIGKSRMSRRRVDEAVFDLLDNYPFPGNVRELDNIIQRTVVMTQKPVITPEDLPDEVRDAPPFNPSYTLHPYERYDHVVPEDRDTLRRLKKEVEAVTFSYQRDLDRRFLLHLLETHDGSARKAAEGASINRTLFYKLLKRAGLDIGTLQKSD